MRNPSLLEAVQRAWQRLFLAPRLCKSIGLLCSLSRFPAAHASVSPLASCSGVVAALHQMGMQCVLLTGDNWRTARAIADQV